MPIRTTLVLLVASSLAAADAVRVTGDGHRFFAMDYDKHVMGVVGPDGTIEWSRHVDGGPHDAWRLPDGRFAWAASGDRVLAYDPATEQETVIYQATPPAGERVEIHGFQPTADGGFVVFESGTKRAVTLDAAGQRVAEVALPIAAGDPHHHMRNARVLPDGGFLLCLSADSKVLECDATGKARWGWPTDGKEPYSALRLPDGGTLIGAGNAHRIVELDREGKETWSVEERELPGIQLGWVTQVMRLANGNTVIVNCHAGPENPQLIEVTRDKRVVWTWRDHATFGNALPVAVLLDAGDGVIR